MSARSTPSSRAIRRAIGDAFPLASRAGIDAGGIASAGAPLGPIGASVRAPSPAATAAELCVTMVLDDDALRAVTSGDRGALGDGFDGVIVDMSTVSPAVSREVAKAAEAAGVSYLRAPVSGNPSVVEAGNLTIVV